jgi:hypothetical protein
MMVLTGIDSVLTIGSIGGCTRDIQKVPSAEAGFLPFTRDKEFRVKFSRTGILRLLLMSFRAHAVKRRFGAVHVADI